jgi:hypothetical protein
MSPAQFPTLIHVWIAALFAAILLRTFLMPVPPNDVWWQLAMGRLIVHTGGILTHDVFSFTQAGQPYYNQPWLAQLLMYGLHRVGGVPLLLVGLLLLTMPAAAILLNPRGIGVLGYVANLTQDPTIRSRVTEWERPTIASLDGKVFFAFTTVLALALAVARRRAGEPDAEHRLSRRVRPPDVRRPTVDQATPGPPSRSEERHLRKHARERGVLPPRRSVTTGARL